MKQKLKYIVGVVLLMAAPHLSFGQYFQRIYDADSGQDWGVNIFLQADGNYFVKGTFLSINNSWALFNMQLSADGNTVLDKNILQYNGTSIYGGDPEETKTLNSGEYISPASIDMSYDTFYRCEAGLIKFNASGDTIFLKTYTDTSIYYDIMNACAVMPDGGYLLGGGRSYDAPSYYQPLLLIRTDSTGDTLWTRTYQKNDTQSAVVNNVIPLEDGRIVVAAMSSYQVIIEPSAATYNHNVPWFLVLDSAGNILKDTAYSSTYMIGVNPCGSLYKDMNGGYIHIGVLDTYDASDPYGIENFPAYIAHLDTNFNMTWITNFSYSGTYGHRQGVLVHQLQDSSYVVVGDATGPYAPTTEGFAAKISKTGTIVWSNRYYSDTTQYAYFRGVIEKPDGGLVFTGATYNDTCPSWHDHRDMWLVSVDSNGNLPPDTTTGVHVSPAPSNGVAVYPNPTSGSFTVEAPSGSPQGGEVLIYDVQGQCMASYKIKGGANSLQLPTGISAGMYICKYIPGEGDGVPAVVRLVYAP